MPRRTKLSNAYCPLPYDLGHKFTELFKNGNSVDLRGIIVVYDQSIADTECVEESSSQMLTVSCVPLQHWVIKLVGSGVDLAAVKLSVPV